MSVLTSKRTYVALAAFQAADAVVCGLQIPPIKKAMDDLGVAEELRPVLPIVKGAAAIGLLSVSRFPGLTRLTTFMLTVYFVLAVAAHLRVRDRPVNAVPAAGFLALYAAMTITGPPRR